jgi:hypothetical protein
VAGEARLVATRARRRPTVVISRRGSSLPGRCSGAGHSVPACARVAGLAVLGRREELRSWRTGCSGRSSLLGCRSVSRDRTSARWVRGRGAGAAGGGALIKLEACSAVQSVLEAGWNGSRHERAEARPGPLVRRAEVGPNLRRGQGVRHQTGGPGLVRARERAALAGRLLPRGRRSRRPANGHVPAFRARVRGGLCRCRAGPGCAGPSSARFERRSRSQGRSSHRSTATATLPRPHHLLGRATPFTYAPTVRSPQPERFRQ